jgi:alanine dehydrogenase
MVIGVPKEIKDHETRVGLVPSGVSALREAEHEVLVETHAGEGSSVTDREYMQAGAAIIQDPAELWRKADLVVKVKEPQPPEYDYFRPGLILFTYLHLAPLPELTDRLLASKVNGVAYETIREADGSLPLLTPMSEVAGRMAVQVGAQYLERPNGGRGLLLGGVPGVAPANVVIIGGGVVGVNAAKIAVGMGAHVTIIERDLNRLRHLDDVFSSQVVTLASNSWTIGENIRTADLVIGAVLIPGASAPKLVRRQMFANMKRGAVVVDVAIDQGGCFETSKPTTHTHPTYVVDGVVHYCVANMPGGVPRTSTFALNNATLPYVLQLADMGYRDAMRRNTHLQAGLNVHEGQVTNKAVSEALGLPYRNAASAIDQAKGG